MLHKECTYLSAVLILVLIGEGRIYLCHAWRLAVINFFPLLVYFYNYMLSMHLILSAVDSQCEQNFVFPDIMLPLILVDVDYNHSLCFTCNHNSFTLEAMGNPQTPVTMNTSLVMISTTLVPGKFVLVIPNPRNALGSGSGTFACSINSYRITELGEKSTIIFDSALH